MLLIPSLLGTQVKKIQKQHKQQQHAQLRTKKTTNVNIQMVTSNTGLGLCGEL